MEVDEEVALEVAVPSSSQPPPVRTLGTPLCSSPERPHLRCRPGKRTWRWRKMESTLWRPRLSSHAMHPCHQASIALFAAEVAKGGPAGSQDDPQEPSQARRRRRERGGGVPGPGDAARKRRLRAPRRLHPRLRLLAAKQGTGNIWCQAEDGAEGQAEVSGHLSPIREVTKLSIFRLGSRYL